MKHILIKLLFISFPISHAFCGEFDRYLIQESVGNGKPAAPRLSGMNNHTDSLTQAEEDSILSKIVYLKEITLVGYKSRTDVQKMPDVVGTSIYSGKKSQLIVVDNVQGNVVTNTMRQVMAKVPGIHVWESDGSGIQIGIGARGLSPNRSWEFNVRQNGYDIVADPYGYPEAYYNPQLQAVQRIEIVRGQGALQYGPQFGGMVNYILKNGSDIKKPFQYETYQTIGSNGLFNTYNAIGGDHKKFHYYAFFDHRNSEGWRDNSGYYTNAGFGTFTYQLNEKFSVTAEITHSHINSQQPGGLTDEQVEENTQSSSRSRNWLDIKWTTAALSGNYIFDEKTNSRLNVKLYGVLADRADLGFLKPITIRDTINPITLQYDNRQLQQDLYSNIGTEARYLTDYSLSGGKHTFSAGLRYYRGYTDRSRLGVGDKGTGFNKVFVIKHQDLDLHTYNPAAFAENIFRVTDKFFVIPGLRFEHLVMTASGRLSYDTNGTENFIKDDTRSRTFLLPGIGAEYRVSTQTKIYANYTQAYRPMLFYDVSVLPSVEVIDPDLKDSHGYNLDLGYKGKLSDYFIFDMSIYHLQYNNRIGVITQQRSDGSTYNYRTNVGQSATNGYEGFFEASPLAMSGHRPVVNFRIFASYSYTDSHYEDFKVITLDANKTLVEKNLKNNKVENTPVHILRTGITGEYKDFSLTYQFSHVSEAFADANNTMYDPTAIVGLIPSYNISDLHAAMALPHNAVIKAGINNLADARYFTRRAPAIPGPGAMPSDGRSFYISVGGNF